MAHSTTAADRRRLGVPDTRPRPLRQSLWIMGSVVASGLAVLSVSGQANQTGAAITAGLEGADLIELADQGSSTGEANLFPASPSTTPEPGATPEVTPEATGAATDDGPDGLAATGVDDDADLPEHERVGRDALAGISYPWQELLDGWTIEFKTSTDGLFGLTLVPERRIEIYVRPDQSPAMVRHVIAHELGHAVDVTLNDGPDRRRWEEARDLSSAPWWPDSGAADFRTGAGDFAESFAAWQVGPSGFRSELAPPPNGSQIELLAELSAS